MTLSDCRGSTIEPVVHFLWAIMPLNGQGPFDAAVEGYARGSRKPLLRRAA